MARLSDAAAERLIASVGRAGPPPSERAESGSGGLDAAAALAERLTEFFRAPQAVDDLGRRLTLDLAAYLNRPVRCSANVPAAPVADAWRFEMRSGDNGWWLDIDVGLATAFADAMIGGDGAAALGRGRRVRSLAETVALRIVATTASAAGMEPSDVVSIGDTGAAKPNDGEQLPLVGGLCAVATDQYAWQLGIRTCAGARAEAQPPVPLSSASPVIAYEPVPAPAEQPRSLEAIVAALRARLSDTAHAAVTARTEPVETDDPQIHVTQPVALGLAVTAGGTGAVIALLDSDAVAGLAGAAAGSPVPPSEPAGDVIVAAAEAVMRDALSAAGRVLPGIASHAQRVVRLTDIPIPARLPHHVVEMHVDAGARSGGIRLLVPSWMLSSAAESSR